MALEVGPAEVPAPRDQASNLPELEPRIGTSRRVDDPFVKVVGESSDAMPEIAQQPSGRASNPPPPIEPAPAARPPVPSGTGTKGRDAPRPATAPQPGSTPAGSAGPPPAITPAPAPTTAPARPAPGATQSTPGMVPQAPTPPPAPTQAAEPTPTAEPGPSQAAEPVPAATAPVPPTPAAEAPADSARPSTEQSSTTGQTQTSFAVPSAQASPAVMAAGSVIPSPQAGFGSQCKPAKKKCFLLTWLHDLHPRKSDCDSSCQIAPLAYPTSYYACLPNADQPLFNQAWCCPGQSAVCFDHRCVCLGQTQEVVLAAQGNAQRVFQQHEDSRSAPAPVTADAVKPGQQGCKPCGRPAGTGKCGGIAYPWASPQAGPAAPAPTGQADASLSSKAGNVAEREQVLERIAANGLDEPAQR